MLEKWFFQLVRNTPQVIQKLCYLDPHTRTQILSFGIFWLISKLWWFQVQSMKYILLIVRKYVIWMAPWVLGLDCYPLLFNMLYVILHLFLLFRHTITCSIVCLFNMKLSFMLCQNKLLQHYFVFWWRQNLKLNCIVKEGKRS